jgi:hypothetical protein
MDNKFMNLKKEYRDFLKKIAIDIRELDIDNNLTMEKCIDVYKLYLNIYASVEKSDSLNINDINHIILNYSKEDNDVELLKKFIKIKNLYLIKKIIKSSQWESFISKLNEDINIDDIKINKKKKELLISKGVYKLLNSYIEHFRGCWEIAEFKDDKLKKLEIIEPEHNEFLINYLKNKIQN